MTPDHINAAFEFFGAFALANNCRVIYHDKMVAGVSWMSVGFFFMWGLWNLYFYHNLEQDWSWWAGALLTGINGLYVYLLLYYGKRKGEVK